MREQYKIIPLLRVVSIMSENPPVPVRKFSNLIATSTKGLIIREDILSAGLRTEDGRVAYFCRIKRN